MSSSSLVAFHDNYREQQNALVSTASSGGV